MPNYITMILEVHNTSDDDCNAASDQKMSTYYFEQWAI